MAELIEMPVWLWAEVGSRDCVLDEGPHPYEKGNFEEGKGQPIVKYRDTLE